MYMLIGFSLLIASGFLVAFIWAIRNGQYDDKYTPSVRILFDDEDDEGDDKPENGCDDIQKDKTDHET